MPAILLVKTSSLGDVVHNLPVVADLHARLPGVQVDWVVEEGFVELLSLHPGIREVLPVAIRRWRGSLARGTTWRQMAAFRRALAARRYDHVIDTQGLLKSALVARCARGRRCGYGAEAAREPLAARFYDATFGIPRNLHAVERNRWLVAAAIGYDPDGPLDYGIAAPPLAAAWLPARRYAVLLTATSRDDKLWPDEHWLALAAALAGAGFVAVLPAGSPAERDRAARLAAGMDEAVPAPPLGLAALAGLLAGAALVVGVDTGLTHLAAAVGVPVIALFRASDPALTGVRRDARALNLGERGAPPAVAEVVSAALRLAGR